MPKSATLTILYSYFGDPTQPNFYISQNMFYYDNPSTIQNTADLISINFNLNVKFVNMDQILLAHASKPNPMFLPLFPKVNLCHV